MRPPTPTEWAVISVGIGCLGGALFHLFLAGEPLDEPTHRWMSEALGKPVIDHYWQTESGWPIRDRAA